MMMKLLGAPKQPHKDPLEEVVSVRFKWTPEQLVYGVNVIRTNYQV